MNNATLLDNLVPVSEFSHGGASRQFARVGDGNPVIVMKNNRPSAVIISPDDYKRFLNAQEDLALYAEAQERLDRAEGHFLSHEEAFGDKGFQYTDADLDDVEFER